MSATASGGGAGSATAGGDASTLEATIADLRAELKGQSERYEQSMASAEHQFATLREEKELADQKVKHSERERRDATERLESMQSALRAANEKIGTLETAVATRVNDLALAQMEKKRLFELNSKQQLDIDQLTKEVRASTDRALTLNTTVSEYQNKLAEGDAARTPLLFQVTQLTQEKDLYQKQARWLEQELARKSDDFLAERKTASSTELRLKTEVATATDRIEQLTTSLSDSQAKATELNSKLVCSCQRTVV